MVKITSDSTSDLGESFAARGIDVLPLVVTLGENSYYDGLDIQPPEIFDYVKKTGILPKTAARSIEDFTSFFKKYTDEGHQVIHFNISSHFSSSNQYANAAAQSLPGVYVIDTLNLSSGSGLLVMYAQDLADQGTDAETIVQKVKQRVPYVQASFVVDTMDYLKKGGRCSGVASFAASVLKIKPTILVKDGKMVVGKKYMGSFDKVILKYVDDTLASFNNPDPKRIFITHTHASPEVVEAVRNKIIENREKAGKPAFENIIETLAGCTITSHCGKSTLGILFINDGGENA